MASIAQSTSMSWHLLGGVGKTQTAVEYAHRHLAEYAHAFWVPAASRETLTSTYVAIANRLNLAELNTQDQILAVGAVKRWLISRSGWLLILDNADDLAMTREFIPSGKNGHVLLTTRARATGAVARLVEIQEMGTEEGSLLLLRRAKYIAEDAPLGASAELEQATAKEIVTQLDGLPLALDQAGAYIEETSCGLSSYLDLYRSHGLELLRRRGGLPSDHPDSGGHYLGAFVREHREGQPSRGGTFAFLCFPASRWNPRRSVP
jgi:hypothetical protein